MKGFALLILLIYFHASAHAEIIELRQAIAEHKIEAIITGNSIQENPQQNSHIGKCLKIKLTNQSQHPIDIRIENGTWCTNLTRAHQDLIISEGLICHLEKPSSKEVILYAFCGEKNDGSPSEKDSFQVLKPLQPILSTVTRFLEQKKLFCHTGQVAVWCVTDHEELSQIYNTHENPNVEKELIALVAHELNLPIPKPISNSPIRIRLFPLEVEGQFSEHIDIPTTHGIYLTDSTHKVLETIIPDETERRSGTIRLQYGVRLQYPEGTYYIELKTNQVFSVLKKITLNSDLN